MTDVQNFVLWSFPTRVVLGEDAAAQCATEAHQLGAKRVLLISDRGVDRAGLLDPIRSALDAAGLAHQSVLDVSSNPLESEVMAAASAFENFGADLVLGVGGGSVDRGVVLQCDVDGLRQAYRAPGGRGFCLGPKGRPGNQRQQDRQHRKGACGRKGAPQAGKLVRKFSESHIHIL